MDKVPSWAITAIGAAGASIAGPCGAFIGVLAGGLVATVLPGASILVRDMVTGLANKAIDQTTKTVVKHLTPPEKQRINHDLQAAFRDAFGEALIDLGGPHAFPQPWREKIRDIPPQFIFLSTPEGDKLWREKNPLAEQVVQCFKDMQKALKEEKLLPRDPPADVPAASVMPYLEAETPLQMSSLFFDQAVAPFLAGYGTLTRELPGFVDLLRRHMLDRTLIHLGENLKTRERAWRGFSRMMLEDLRDHARHIERGQEDILKRLDALLDSPDGAPMAALSDTLADLMSATGQVEKQVEESFEALSTRVVEQHRELLARFDALMATSMRIETKVDRVLRILEDGRYIIEGTATVVVDAEPTPGEPPFKGLQFFDQEDVDLFFGREILTAHLTAHLGEILSLNRLAGDGKAVFNRGKRRLRFLAVVGASGSGKSSVVRAGLLPALQSGEPLEDGTLPPEGCSRWPLHIITPTAHPLEALAASLTRGAESTSATAALITDLEQDPAALNLHVRKMLSQDGRQAQQLLLVVDQFEELFTLCHFENERRAFVEALMSGAAVDGPLLVVITLRADFYAACAQYSALRQALETNQAYIGPMNREELRRAIQEPARRGGSDNQAWEFERGLVDLMLRDVGDEPGALPLLSHALLETWKHRRGNVMTLESYAEAGGVRGAIARTAETVYAQRLTPEQQIIARNIFLRLTEPGEGTADTRRRATLSELIPHPQDAPLVQSVLATLTEARLVTTSEGSAEVAHEALIREWPTLRRWLDENRAGLRLHRQLSDDAQDWLRLNRDAGALYRGLRLAQVVEWAATHDDQLSMLEREFVAASRALADQIEAEKQAQQRRELEAARRLAEEADARRKAEEERARQAEQSARQLSNRMRVIMGVSAVAGVAALFALCFAITAGFFSFQSNRNLKVAQARELAARANSAVARDADLGLLLAVQGMRLANQTNQTIPEAQSALFNTLQETNYWKVLRPVVNTGRANDRLWLAGYSWDNKLIVTSSGEGDVRLYTPQGDLLSRLIGHSGRVLSIDITRDGERLVTGSQDKTARLWKPNGTLLAILDRHTDEVVSARFSPDGKQILTASLDGSARLWDAETGEQLAALRGHDMGLLSATYSPDGERVVTASMDNTLCVWQARGQSIGKLLLTLEGHTGFPMTAVFSPNGRFILSGAWDGTARLWDARNGEELVVMRHNRSINTAFFSPDGKYIVTSSYDTTARLWNLNGDLLTTFQGHTAPVLLAIFSPDSQQVLTSSNDGTARLWSLDGTQMTTLRGHTDYVYTALFSPDGKEIVTAGADGTVRLYHHQRLFSAVIQGHASEISGSSFSPDGQGLATTSSDSSLRIFDVDGQLTKSITSTLAELGALNSVVFSTDGKRMLVSGFKSTAALLGRDGRVVQYYRGGKESLNSAVFSPDEKLVATAADDGTARLFNTADGSQVAVISGVQGWINTVHFSPDGKLLLTSGEDQTARLWNLNGTLYKIFEGHTGAVTAAIFRPDGSLIATASADRSVRLWRLDGTALDTLPNHPDLIWSITFSPDGKLLAAGCMDGSIWLWQVDQKGKGKFLATLEGHKTSITSLSFAPDGHRLLSTCWDGTARLWDIVGDVAQMEAEATRRVGRSLTTSECQRYLNAQKCP